MPIDVHVPPPSTGRDGPAALYGGRVMAPPDRLRDDHLECPDPWRLAPTDAAFAVVMAAHARAVASGAPTYRDPRTGFEVFTAAALAERGVCCESGCRHCPYVGAS